MTLIESCSSFCSVLKSIDIEDFKTAEAGTSMLDLTVFIHNYLPDYCSLSCHLLLRSIVV